MKPQLVPWSPATCGCRVIEYTDENGNVSCVTYEEAIAIHEDLFKNYDGVKDPQQFPQKPPIYCPAHTGVGDHKELYEVLMQEGRTFCSVERAFLGYDNSPIDLSEVGSDGERKLKEGVKLLRSFEGEGKNRVLKVSVVGEIVDEATKKQFAKSLKTERDFQIL